MKCTRREPSQSFALNAMKSGSPHLSQDLARIATQMTAKSTKAPALFNSLEVFGSLGNPNTSRNYLIPLFNANLRFGLGVLRIGIRGRIINKNSPELPLTLRRPSL